MGGLKDLDRHRLPAESALELANLHLGRPQAADRHHILVRSRGRYREGHRPRAPGSDRQAENLDPLLDRILRGLALADWNVDRASGLLGLGRATVFRRLKAWGLSLAAARRYHESRYGLDTRDTPAGPNRTAESVSA